MSRLAIPFVVDARGAAERAPYPGESARAYALALARHKAGEAAKRHAGAVLLAADTVVTIDESILGKPRDHADAFAMLRRLSGRCHSVVTGVAVRCATAQYDGVLISEVCMDHLADDQLRDYIAGGEPMDKAGSYALQGAGSKFVQGVRGCYNNVVGLPLCLSTQLLEHCGVHVDWARELDPHIRHTPESQAGF